MEKRPDLPPSGTLEIDFAYEAFTLLANKTIKHLDVVIMIHLQNSKAKLTINITNVIKPDGMSIEIINSGSYTNLKDLEKSANAFHRATIVAQMKLEKKAWYLYGTTCDNSQRPICIVIYPNFI